MAANKPNNGTGQTPEELQEELQKEYDTLKAKPGKTADDFKKLTELKLKINSTGQKSIGDLQKELDDAEKEEDREKASEIKKQIDDLKNNALVPQKDHLKEIEDIFNDKSTKNRSKEKKDNIRKLLEDYKRQWETKNQSLESEKNSLGKKPQNTVLNDLYNKLMDNDDKMEMGGKIEKVNSSILPFIPSLKSKVNPDLKKRGVVSFNLGEVEILTYSGWKRRNKMNRVANELNKIDTDSEKAVRYLFSMSKKRFGGRPGALMKQAFRSRFDAKKMFNRNPEEFETKAKQKMKDFIEEITDGHETEEVKVIMKQIDDRFSYHIRNYKVTQASKWMG